MARVGKTLLRVLGLPLLGLALSWAGAAGPARALPELPGQRPAPQEDRLSFKIMLSTYLGKTGQLHQNSSGRLEITVDGQAWGVFWTTPGGKLDFSIPSGRPAEWLLVTDAHSPRHFRSEFQNGLLKILNLDRDGREVRYFLAPDGAYALEYWQEWLYITNQGQIDAPILAWLRSGREVAAGGRLLPQVAPTIRSITPDSGRLGTAVHLEIGRAHV
jgi:hypothetical protein